MNEEEMINEFIMNLDEKDQVEDENDISTQKNCTVAINELLQNFIYEKRINLLFKKKLLHLECLVNKIREEKEVRNYFNQYFAKDVYLKNQVIHSEFHQGSAETFYLDKKTKNTRKKNCK